MLTRLYALINHKTFWFILILILVAILTGLLQDRHCR